MVENKYLDRKRLGEDMDKLEEFISQELEVEYSDSALMLLNHLISKIQEEKQRQLQQQAANQSTSFDDSTDYIG